MCVERAQRAGGEFLYSGGKEMPSHERLGSKDQCLSHIDTEGILLIFFRRYLSGKPAHFSLDLNFLKAF